MSAAAALYCASLAAVLAQRGHAVRLSADEGRPLAAICVCFLVAGLACLILRGA